MGEGALENSPTIPETTSIVAPYAADIDPMLSDTVKYTEFTSSSNYQIRTVSNFIDDQTGDNFDGTYMMVAEWRNVVRYNSRYSAVSIRLHVLYIININFAGMPVPCQFCYYTIILSMA